MKKLHIAVLMGGPSEEHEISLSSGESILENLGLEKYAITKIVISKNGEWLFDDTSTFQLAEAIDRLKQIAIDVVVLALHGTFGEDGTIQALLEQQGLAFTGSQAKASLLAMDKTVSNALYESIGLQVPSSRTYHMSDINEAEESIKDAFTFPLVIKPVRQGSSVGVHIVKTPEDIYPAIQDAFLFDSKIMAQEFIAGREVSCGVLEDMHDRRPYALPPTELIPLVSEFFDYEAKYSVGGTKEVTPPDLPSDTIHKIQAIAVKSHELLGCAGYSRTDMMVGEKGIFVIETNTLPGMMPTSILPQQAAEAGISFSDLLDYMIQSAYQSKSTV